MGRSQQYFVGQTFTNNDGDTYKIIKYVNAKDITVQFTDGAIKQAQSRYIKSGKLRNPNFKLTNNGIFILPGFQKSQSSS